jgi:hypothetical protein
LLAAFLVALTVFLLAAWLAGELSFPAPTRRPLRVYAHWLPDTATQKGVDCLDESTPSVAQSLLHTPPKRALRRIA